MGQAAGLSHAAVGNSLPLSSNEQRKCVSSNKATERERKGVDTERERGKDRAREREKFHYMLCSV